MDIALDGCGHATIRHDHCRINLDKEGRLTVQARHRGDPICSCGQRHIKGDLAIPAQT